MSANTSKMYPITQIKPKTMSGNQQTDEDDALVKSSQFEDALLQRRDTEIRTNAATSSPFKKFNLIKNKAIRAIKDGKIFIIVGNFPVVRSELKKRGWVEKIIAQPTITMMPDHQVLLEFAEDGNEFERQILSSLVADYPADFVFGPSSYTHDFGICSRVNIAPMKNFTRKDSLCNCLLDVHFYTVDGLSEVCIPRSFKIVDGILNEFIDEYRLNMCRSFLYYISEHSCSTSDAKKDITEEVTKIAKFVHEIINIQIDHIDIDELFSGTSFSENEWDNFFTLYKDIVKFSTSYTLNTDLNAYILEVIDLVKKHWPTSVHDGFNNLWVLKPCSLCGGSGVMILDTLAKIESGVTLRKGNCVLQKYIERPLLIYKTKFDIRYFFLISMNNGHLQLWEYTNCYLRFSSEEFDLNDLRAKIHLTNHTIQMRHKNGARSEKLPPHNMWNLNDFQEYLESINEGDKWKKHIYPAIKKNLTGVVMLGLEDIDFRPNRFHIFGADFLIAEDFSVYLLEVNRYPAIQANTTVVTEVIFRKVVEDTIKVVLDLPQNNKTETGDYKLLYEIPFPKYRNITFGMFVAGKKSRLFDANQILGKRQKKMPNDTINMPLHSLKR